jgi:arylsulfatase
MESSHIVASQALAPGKYTLVYDFKYDGSGAGKGGTGTLMVNRKKVAEGRIERTQSGIFSVDDLADVGMDEGTPVADYGASSKFNGKIEKLKIETRK